MEKHPAYSKYRSSGVEWFPEIPKSWDALPARRIFMQARDPASPVDEQLAATQKYGVIPQRLFMEYEDQKVVLALSGTGNFKHVEIDDFVISLRSFQGGIERCHYAGCVSPAYTVMRREKAIDASYFSFLLKSEGFITALQSVTQGIREGKTVTYEQFGSIPLPFPSRGEQIQIAAFLNHETTKIDRLIARQERLIELLKEKRQAAISHAVTKGLNPDAPMKDSGVEWLGEVPAHWVVTQLKRFSNRVVVGIAEAATHAYVDEGIPILRATNVRTGKLIGNLLYLDPSYAAERGSKRIRGGDLVTVRTGNAGVTAIVPDELDGCQCFTMLITTLKKTHSNRFFEYLINSPIAQSYFSVEGWGTAQVNISVPILQNLPVAAPNLKEQESIVIDLDRKVVRFDELITKAQRAIELLQEHRIALISAAVTGKIDVRGWQKPDTQPQETATAVSA